MQIIYSVLTAATKPAINSLTASPSALKDNTKKEDGGKAEDSGLSFDQLVPDYASVMVNDL